VDAVVTDPPYELGFMGKAWDKSGIAYTVELWQSVLRVLKPGGHLLAFGGSRTYHRMAVAIEDAGFEIRDQIQWIYGSGFPKSLDVGKAIDRMKGAKRKSRNQDNTKKGVSVDFRMRKNCLICGKPFFNQDCCKCPREDLIPISDEAKQWNGFGTALKPAHEPICLARKPLEKGMTVAQNVLKWGTGALNIDGCRIRTGDSLGGGGEKAETDVKNKPEGWDRPWMHNNAAVEAHASRVRANVQHAQALGRFPANVIHDGSDEVEAGFPQTTSGTIDPTRHTHKNATGNSLSGSKDGSLNNYLPHQYHNGDSGSASRFFYAAKASQAERNRNGSKNVHPTVKPIALMQYLCRLVTPPQGLILDPFNGSGSTGIAALIEQFSYLGIELNEEYLEISRRRLAEIQTKLF
ncbi:MAG: site-specific DNA-methyltransferase, partial [Blastocatellia bacterium]|nr:site-specific DNA-methyltransferase [Blastocatellia bacterium]